jgi:hypothetical protein
MAIRKTTIGLTRDELSAMNFIRRARPDLLTDAAVRRAALIKLAKELGWDHRKLEK